MKNFIASVLAFALTLSPASSCAEGAALSAAQSARAGAPYVPAQMTRPGAALYMDRISLNAGVLSSLNGGVSSPLYSLSAAQAAAPGQTAAYEAASYAPAASVQNPEGLLKPADRALKTLSQDEAVAPLAQNGAAIGAAQGLQASRAFFDRSLSARLPAAVSALGLSGAPAPGAVLSKASARSASSGESLVERLPAERRSPGILRRLGFFLAMLAPLWALSAVFLTPGVSPSGIIHQGRNIEIRNNASLNSWTIAQIQQSMILQDLALNNETSSLKFFLGSSDFDNYRLQDMAALADTMRMIGRPVDIILKTELGADSLGTFLSATGKRYMMEGAYLQIGPIQTNMASGKNKDAKVRVNLFNSYLRELERLVMEKAGVDRVQANKDLLSAKTYNSMQALYYGKAGLIDGILVGYDDVITRQDMDKYFSDNKLGPEARAEFTRDYTNVSKLPKRPLRAFSRSSVPSRDYALYKSPLGFDNNLIKNLAGVFGGPIGPTYLAQDAIAAILTKTNPVFYSGATKLGEYPVQNMIASGPSSNMAVDRVPGDKKGFLYDDTIWFNDGFRDGTARQVAEALVKFDEKKSGPHERPSNIRIYLNSPGGSVTSAQELRGTIRSLKHPVDVVVQGMGASAGSWLLSSATGKRFATPNARVMIHEAAFRLPQLPANHSNEEHDMLDQVTIDYVRIVAQATGKDFKEVLKDFDRDTWFNPVEALMYGKKGLIDAVLVGPDRIITRSDVEAYLLQKLKTKAAVERYLERKWQEKRDPRLAEDWRPEKHDENDVFDNYGRTIQELAPAARPLAAVPGFERSAPAPRQRMIEFYNAFK